MTSKHRQELAPDSVAQVLDSEGFQALKASTTNSEEDLLVVAKLKTHLAIFLKSLKSFSGDLPVDLVAVPEELRSSKPKDKT